MDEKCAACHDTDGFDSPAVKERQAQFKRITAWLPVPQPAQQAWLESTHYPVSSFFSFHVSLMIQTLLYALQFFLGTRNFPLHKGWLLPLGAVLTVNNLTFHAGHVVYGPNALARLPILLAPVVINVICIHSANVLHVFGPESLVPYQSRLAYLITTSVIMIMTYVTLMHSILVKERGPPSTHPFAVLSRATMLAFCNADTLSDGMVVRVLWERVRPPPLGCGLFLLSATEKLIPQCRSRLAPTMPWTPNTLITSGAVHVCADRRQRV